MMTKPVRPRIAIYIRGGNLMDIACTCEGVEAMVVDYDNEEHEEVIDRAFIGVRCDPELIGRTIAGTEQKIDSNSP